MFELGLFLLADAAGLLTNIYWGCLVVGGGLLLISVLGSGAEGGDADIGLDADVDIDADFDVDAGDVAESATGLTKWFSMRFVVSFVAAFGFTGVVLRYTSSLDAWIAFAIAIAVGAVVGEIAHQIFRFVRVTSGDSTPRAHDYVNKLARVTIAIEPSRKGEVALQVRGSRRHIPAVTGDEDQGFDKGDDVVVVGYSAGIARVISRVEFEQRDS